MISILLVGNQYSSVHTCLLNGPLWGKLNMKVTLPGPGRVYNELRKTDRYTDIFNIIFHISARMKTE